MTSHRIRSLTVAFAFLGSWVVSAVPSHAQELLTPRVTTRKFPQGVFCPLPLEMSFVADGSTATLRFSTTTVNYFNTDNSQNQWSKQSLDNICVVSDPVYQANLGPLGSYSADCYFPHPEAQLTETFYFQNAGVLPLKEEFDILPIGWDLSHGAYWNSAQTAPHDPGTDVDFSPLGSLGLGEDTVAKALTDSAFTTKQVSGLTNGVTYHLTGWWTVDDMQLDKVSLTVVVLSDNPTPIARKTWGALKRMYH